MRRSQLLLVTALALFTALPATHANSCPAGTFTKQGRCIPCPPGTYQETANSTSCEFCGAGRYNPFKGARSYSNCLECPAGTFSKSRAARCTTCPRGTSSRKAYSKCLSCPPGSGLSEYDVRCEKCPPAWYRPAGVPSTTCLLCPSGTGSKRGATKCEKCAKGTFRDRQYIGLDGRNEMVECRDCPPNTFADVTGSVQCKLCPLGTITTERGSKKCKSCPTGTFRGLIKKRDCKPCPEGTNSRGKNPAACKHPTRGCPVNTFEDIHGECRACMSGERLDMERKKCVPCRPRQISLGGVSRECKTCPRGQRPANTNTIFEKSRCECEDGTVSDGAGGCKKCPAGTSWDNRPAGAIWYTNKRVFYYVESGCRNCGAGFFADRPGMAECKPCADGTFANVEGSTRCRQCPEGFVSRAIDPLSRFEEYSNDRTNCLSEKTGCEIGEVQSEDGFCSVRRCLPDTAPSKYGGCDTCFFTGQFYIPGKMDCEACPRGETNPQGVFKKCVVCPKGAEGDDNGRCECRGEFGDDGRGGCKKCRKGELSTAGACGPCPESSFYRMTKNGPECKACTGNTIKLRPSHRRCTKCPTGFKKERDVFGEKVNRCIPEELYPVE